MMKRILSFILVSAFLFASLSLEISAQIPNYEYNNEYSELLFSLDVLDSSELNGNPVTRAQFVKYAMKLAGIQISPYKGTEFKDVPNSHADYGYIMSAVDFGLISIAEYFRPDDTIAPTEALKIIVHLLGYDFMAASKGGYPTGYLQTAQTIDLSKGIDISVLTMSDYDVCALLYNALNVKLPEVSYTEEGNEYYIGTATILQKYRGIIEVTGIVDGVSHYSEYNVQGLGESRISINGTIYSTGSLNCDSLFGYDVVAYYDTKAKCLITCTPTDSNNVVSIYAEDIVSFKNGTFEYIDKDYRNKTLSIKPDSTIFYNGRLFNYNELKMLPESGSLTFVSPSGSGAYTTLYIKSYRTIVVSSVSASNKYYLADKYSSADVLVIDPNETEVIVTDQDGNSISFSSIVAGDVVNAAVSDDGKYIELICVKDEFLGICSGYREDYIEINGSEYRLTDNLKDKALNIINLGKYAVFKFDIDQRVADIIPSEGVGEQLGYLVVGKPFKNGLTTKFGLRIMNLDGVIYDYEFSDSFSINGKNYKDYELAYSEHKGTDYNSLLCGIIQYSITDDGKVKSIMYSDKDGGNGGIYHTNSLLNNSSGAKFSQWFYNINNTIVCDTNTVIIKVPNPIYSVDSVDETLYSIENWSLIQEDGSSKGYIFHGYTTNQNDGMSKYLVMQAVDDISGGSGIQVDNTYAYMVGSLRQVVVDDEPRESMVIYNRSSKKTVYSQGENDFSAAGISGGDIIRINANEKNVVRAIELVWKHGSELLENASIDNSANTSSRTPAYAVRMGYVYSVRTDVLDVYPASVSPDTLTDNDIIPLYLPQTKILKYDERLKSVVELTREDLKDYKHFGEYRTKVIYCTANEALLNVFVIE